MARRHRPGWVIGTALLLGCPTDAPPEPAQDGSSSTSAEDAGSTAASPGSSGIADSGSTTSTSLGPDTFTGPGSDDTASGGNTPKPEEVDYELCELDLGPNASVVGTTPEGPFEGLYAWFGWLTCNGDGLSPTLVLLQDPADLAAAVAVSPSGDAIPTPSIEWYLFGACSPSGGWVGEGNVTVYLRTDGPWHQAGGMIEIYDTHRIFDVVDPADPPRMHGFISIHEGEFDIEGEFTAGYCGPLSYPLGCE